MTDPGSTSTGDSIEKRVRAIERTLTDGDLTLPRIEDRADLVERVDDLESRTDAIEGRLDDLDAATQALRGYVGNVRSVNREVERRADAALAAVEAMEADEVPEPIPTAPERPGEEVGDGSAEQRRSGGNDHGQRHGDDGDDGADGGRSDVGGGVLDRVRGVL